MIVSKNVELGGIKLKKWYSDNLKKIKCNEDNNIYSAAYTSRDANLSFEETNLPLNEIIAGAIISVDDVWGLSDVYVQKTELNDAISSIEDSIDDLNTSLSNYVPSSRKINGSSLSGDISVGTITSIRMNGMEMGSGGSVDLGTVLSAH